MRPFFIACLIYACSVNPLSGRPLSDEDARLLDTVLVGIENNNQKLGALSLVMTTQTDMAAPPESTVDRAASGLTFEEPEVSNGLTFEEPEISSGSVPDIKMILSGASLRRECGGSVIVRHNGKWTQYEPSQEIAWKRDVSPPFYALDPRQFAIEDPNMTFRTLLSEDRVKQIESNGDFVEIRTRGEAPRDLVFRVDPKKNFLPVAAGRLHRDGRTFNTTMRLNYQFVSERAAWLLETAEDSIYPKRGVADSLDSDAEPSMKSIVNVVRFELLDAEQISDAFAVDLAPGTQVRDEVERSVDYVPQEESSNSWMTMTAFGAIIAVVFFFVRRNAKEMNR